MEQKTVRKQRIKTLPPETVAKIKEQLQKGVSQRVVAKIFNISQRVSWKIHNDVYGVPERELRKNNSEFFDWRNVKEIF